MGRILAVVTLCALALSGAAFAGGESGFTPVEPASPNAEGIKQSYMWVAIFTGAILVLVQGTLVWFIVRYRADRRARDVDGAQVHGNTNLELAWTVAPVLILVAIGSFIFYKLPGIEDVPAADRTEVAVEGHRYYWNFIYPNGVIAVNTLRAPVGRNTRLEVSAPDYDVIHSWWIPALGGKFDAIPGRINVTWFNPYAAGTYKGQCAELCGAQHALMTAQVEAMPPEEFDDWLATEAEAQLAGTSQLGAETFLGACSKCHGEAGEGGVGPRLAGNQLLDDPEAVEQVVRNGRNAMPPVGKNWDERQMKALTDYLSEELLGG